MSRKRSRSGTRLCHDSQAPEMADRGRPSLTELYLDQYVTRDELQYAALNTDDERRKAIQHAMMDERNNYLKAPKDARVEPATFYVEAHRGLGGGRMAEVPTKIVYPKDRKRPGNRRTSELRVDRKSRLKQAEQLEELVPMRLDLDFDKLKLRDTFTWNLHDRIVPRELFAHGLVEDFNVPPEIAMIMSQHVVQNMQEQLDDFHPHVFIDDDPLDPHLPYSAYKNDEMRILIKLNITIGNHCLVDQFDWDINNPSNTPEDFAMHMAWDMSLSGEFMTAIAHSIREQTQLFTKGLYIGDHPFDGRPVENADLEDALLPALSSVFRSYHAAKEFAPVFYELSEADIERTELAFAREQRQQKRSVNRRGGPTMPDFKERLPTVRTRVVSSVIPGAADSVGSSGIYKFTRTSRRGPRNYRADQEDDEDLLSDQEDSDLDSPVKPQGPNRTRGVRGAASAAQAAMRATLARSPSPEFNLHHHETRTIARRFGGQEVPEGTLEATSLIVTLRLPREKYRQWYVDNRLKQRQQQEVRRTRPVPQPGYIGQVLDGSRNGAPQYGRPLHGSMPPPASTLDMTSEQTLGSQPSYGSNLQFQLPASHASSDAPQQRFSSHGDAAVGTPPSLLTGQPAIPPLPPAWLTVALTDLKAQYPDHSFEPIMRFNSETHQWNPKLRCNDCPGKVYNTAVEEPTANFEVHLNHFQHKENLNARFR